MFLRQTGKTTGKKGSVCFFSLELDPGAVPRGRDDGAVSSKASAGPADVRAAGLGGLSRPLVPATLQGRGAAGRASPAKPGGDTGLQRHEASKAHLCARASNRFLQTFWA